MGFEVQFASDHPEDRPVSIDDECSSAVGQGPRPLDAELGGDAAVGVREQGKAETVVGCELLLPIRPIGANPNNARSEFGEGTLELVEAAGFDRSTRGFGLHVEVHDERALRQQVGGADELTVLVGGGKRCDLLSGAHVRPQRFDSHRFDGRRFGLRRFLKNTARPIATSSATA